MELGEKLRLARLEAGLSQRQLCGDVITRNMLSRIENGAARPSMDTLRFLASRLGKSISFFLEEDAVVSSNQDIMEQLRHAFDTEDWEGAAELLKRYGEPDPVFDREMQLIRAITTLSLGEKALSEGRARYARSLLEEKPDTPYLACELEHRRQLLLGRLAAVEPGIRVEFASLDEELMLRARAALSCGDGIRAGKLLDAAEDQLTPDWNFLRGQCYLKTENDQEAIGCFLKSEQSYPAESAAGLEQCYRNLRDFENAYRYACKLRALKK